MLALLSGFLLLAISIYLAIFPKFAHFYEFMILGLFLVFYSALQGSISKRTYLKLYFLFLGGGMLADLILGILVTKLWYYNYTSFIEYLPLYLLIYPGGGIVLIQSFIFCKHHVLKERNPRPKLNASVLRNLAIFFMLASILLVILEFFYVLKYFGFIFYSSLTLLAFFLFNYFSQRWKKISYFGLFFNRPLPYVMITLTTAFLNALLHEVPNTFAHQWVYQNFPFGNMQVFGITSTVFFLGWAALVMIPISAYYAVRE